MSSVLVDTHAIIWYFLDSAKLSEVARTTIDEANQIYIASISLVEIVYLSEKGKISEIALQRLNQALVEPETQWLVANLDIAIAQSVVRIPRDTVPEMPDRIIAATAYYLDIPLITRDRQIEKSSIKTIW